MGNLVARWLLAGAVAVAAVLSPSAPASVQPVQKAAPTPAMEGFNLLGHGRYLDAIARFREAQAAGDRSVNSMIAQVEPFVTGVPARPAPAQVEPQLDPGILHSIRTASPRPAIDVIVERARRTNLVILNEAHDNPGHRAFALEVARALRPLGYDILAVEAFSNVADARESEAAMEAFARRGYPVTSTGFYTQDPVFGDFLRQALALGYRPVAYEATSRAPAPSPEAGIVAREQEQAENLVARIFSRNPHARVLIFVGYSHAAEAALPGQPEWMAARLKRMTGIDPLTIEQTGLTEFDRSPAVRGYHRAAAERAGPHPVVLSTADGPLVVGRYRAAFDLQVVHPPMRLLGGRPDWLWRIGRRPVPVPRRLRPASGERLIQAFARGESKSAIPLDQVLVAAGKPMPVLMLPDVPVRFAYQELAPGGTSRRASARKGSG